MPIRVVFPPAVYRLRPEPSFLDGVARLARAGWRVLAEDANAAFWSHALSPGAFGRRVEPLRRLWGAFEARGRLSADDVARYTVLAGVVPVLDAVSEEPWPPPLRSPRERTVDLVRASGAWLAMDGDALAHPDSTRGRDAWPEGDVAGPAVGTVFWLTDATQLAPIAAALESRGVDAPHVVIASASVAPVGGTLPVSVRSPDELEEGVRTWLRDEDESGEVTWRRGGWRSDGIRRGGEGTQEVDALPVAWGDLPGRPHDPVPTTGASILSRSSDVIVVRHRHAPTSSLGSGGTGRTAPEQIHAGLRPRAGVTLAYDLDRRARVVLSPLSARVLDVLAERRDAAGLRDALGVRGERPGDAARLDREVAWLRDRGLVRVSEV